MLEDLQYDVFRHLNRRFGVKFATLFCNSTAHFQHYHWRNMEPSYSNSHRTKVITRALKRYFVRLSNHGPPGGPSTQGLSATCVMLCTGLSQQPWTDTAKCTYRPRSFDRLFEFAGDFAKQVNFKPVMARNFTSSAGQTPAEAIETQLLRLYVGTDSVCALKRDGSNLYAACDVTARDMEDAIVIRHSDRADADLAIYSTWYTPCEAGATTPTVSNDPQWRPSGPR